MAPGCRRAGPFPRSEQARRALCRRPGCVGRSGKRLRLVSAGDNEFARHPPPPGPIRLRTNSRALDAGAAGKGATLGATVAGAAPPRSSRSRIPVEFRAGQMQRLRSRRLSTGGAGRVRRFRNSAGMPRAARRVRNPHTHLWRLAPPTQGNRHESLVCSTAGHPHFCGFAGPDIRCLSSAQMMPDGRRSTAEAATARPPSCKAGAHGLWSATVSSPWLGLLCRLPIEPRTHAPYRVAV